MKTIGQKYREEAFEMEYNLVALKCACRIFNGIMRFQIYGGSDVCRERMTSVAANPAYPCRSRLGYDACCRTSWITREVTAGLKHKGCFRFRVYRNGQMFVWETPSVFDTMSPVVTLLPNTLRPILHSVHRLGYNENALFCTNSPS